MIFFIIMKKNKLKFLNFDYDISIKSIASKYPIAENPTKYVNLPDGEYIIRGNFKGYSKEYWKIDNKWFLIKEVTKDNGEYYCNAGKFQLFPSLSEKEWLELNKVWKKLSPYWKRAVIGRNHYMEIRNIKREIKKNFLHYKK